MSKQRDPVEEEQVAPWADAGDIRISRMQAFVTAPEGVPLVVVKVSTSEDGLYGLGCATFTQRYAAVAGAVEHLAEAVVGRSVSDIEDTTRLAHYHPYWRSGPVLNNALSGLDMALWDILGKRAQLPLYQLLGGRCRSAVACYTHASGRDVGSTVERARALVSHGWHHVRLQTGQPGIGTYGAPGRSGGYPDAAYADGWDPRHYLRTTPELFEVARAELGSDVELLHDVHSRLTPKEAIVLARSLEPYRLFFLEDPVAPEHYDQLPRVAAASPVPIAAGELLSSVADATRLVISGGVDYLRLHVSAIGGLTPARKLLAMCELIGVKVAWHGPADVSPVGAAVNIALSCSSHGLGIQEAHNYADQVHEVFPGTPVPAAGYVQPPEAPGIGVDFDPAQAAKYPPTFGRGVFVGEVRLCDGSLIAP